MDVHGSVGADAAAIAAAVYSSCSSTLLPRHGLPLTSAGRLEALFDSSATQQLAFHTILGQVKSHRLAWHSKSGDVLHDVPVPRWWHTFVADCVRSGLLTGVCFYKTYMRRGETLCEVARVTDVEPRWNGKKKCFEASKPGWQIMVFEAPLHRCDSGSSSSRSDVLLRSAAVRAEASTLRLQSLQKNWHLRDHANSRPSVYTTISDALSNQNGSERQWFKNVTNPDVLQTRAVDVDSNFSSLVHKRAETIRSLDALTSLRRNTSSASAGAHASAPGSKPSNERAASHTEHIVSDGRAYTEARPLSSLPDTKIMMDELSHAVFFAFSVPPQALGKNINSERLASSNRLTEMAITAFDVVIRQTRSIIADAIRASTTTPQGSYVSFSLCLGLHELNELLPLLKTKTAITLLSRAYDIPPTFLDPARVEAAQCAEDSEASKKRPRTEEETVAVLRKRAREPST